jgi:hypothetical protein
VDMKRDYAFVVSLILPFSFIQAFDSQVCHAHKLYIYVMHLSLSLTF